jgi:hypothetical protein
MLGTVQASVDSGTSSRRKVEILQRSKNRITAIERLGLQKGCDVQKHESGRRWAVGVRDRRHYARLKAVLDISLSNKVFRSVAHSRHSIIRKFHLGRALSPSSSYSGPVFIASAPSYTKIAPPR